MNITFGYARVSTTDQNPNLQIDALLSAGVEERYIFVEHLSGKLNYKKRPALDRCLSMLRQGDTLMVWRLDRLGRSLIDLKTIMKSLMDNGIIFKSLTEGLVITANTSSIGQLLFNILSTVAELESETIRERAVAGLRAARARGVIGGRRLSLSQEKQNVLTALYLQGHPVNDICGELKITRGTLYQYLARLDVPLRSFKSEDQ